MNKIQEELKSLYPDITLSESEVQEATNNLVAFFKLCMKIVNQSQQTVQGNEQNIVQNDNFLR